MAGRAGRPGLETEGYCHVIAPEKDVPRVKGMFGGHPVGSRLGDDLATHINTEIALGLVRSRADVAGWYARTLHRYVAPRPADLDKPLGYLLAEGFVTERDGVLSPTSLGVAASDLMIRVASAAALEHYIAAEHARTADPDALETELLLAACGPSSSTSCRIAGPTTPCDAPSPRATNGYTSGRAAASTTWPSPCACSQACRSTRCRSRTLHRCAPPWRANCRATSYSWPAAPTSARPARPT